MLCPQPAQRHRREAVAKAQSSLAGIKHDASLEAGAELVTQVAEAGEVAWLNAGSCLDLDSGDLAAALLEDDVDLALLLVAIVEERGWALGTARARCSCRGAP